MLREKEPGKNFGENLPGDSISSEHLTHTEIKAEVFYSTVKKLIDLNSPAPTSSNMLLRL